ncbi:MAG: DUF5034 domain-containing protein [Prolixibacteraceae bacterium]|nr:DUF5034 domain-containing protein [Prolixibacteraceae bacterium]
MFRKLIIILLAVSSLKLLISCIFRCDCPEPDEVEFSLNISHITLIDNAGPYPNYHTDSDSLSSRAIGFDITLTDSTMTDENYAPLLVDCQHTGPFFINGAYAWSCDCINCEFKTKQKLKAIRLITLSDFNNELPAQTDISHLLVGRVNKADFEGHGMYKTLEKTIAYLAEERMYYSPDYSFELYLTKAPKVNSIRFEITFEFDDNSFITDTTETIYPVAQFEL